MQKSVSTKQNSLRARGRSGLNSGLDVLECIAGAGRPLTLTEIAERIAMSKSSVHTLLATLQQRGYLHRLADQSYAVGLRTWEVGCTAGPMGLGRIAGPHMAQLVRDIADGVSLGVLDGGEMVCVQLVESPRAVRVHANVGDRTPAHCVSSGLAFLAQLPEEAVRKLFPEKLMQPTPNTLATREELIAELRRVRARGHSFCRGAWRIEVGGVSVPVLGPNDQVVAALCVAAPSFRTTRDWVASTVSELKSTARAIERDLGRADESRLVAPASRKDRSMPT